MKSFKYLLLTVLFTLFVFNTPVRAQEKRVQSHISYKVDFGPVYPIEGDNYQIMGKIALDDTTDNLEKINFDVPLNMFTGINSGYLAWVGNSWKNPEMTFSSKSIEDKGNGELTVKGNMEFRRRTAPVTIDFTRKDIDDRIVLNGDFYFNPKDYFIISPSIQLVPNNIPFKVTLVFDKPTKENKNTVSIY